MTISKTDLLSMGFVRQGSPFIQIAARSDIDSTDSLQQGLPYYGPGNDTTPVYPTQINSFTRQGSPFDWATAKESINASGDYVIYGYPFYVPFGSAYNTTQFFMVF